MRRLIRRRDADSDLRAQIDSHIEEATEEFVRQGMSPEDARRAALLDFGSVVRTEEECRDLRGSWRRDLMKDFGYALRMLLRNPAFAAVALLSLSAGIAANSAIFSIVNSILLRPRAVFNPSELVELYTGERHEPYQSVSFPSYQEFRDRNGVFTGLAAYGISQLNLGEATQVEQVWGEVISGNYFAVLGVNAAIGRTFAADEDLQPGRNPVVVIADRLWRRRFNSDPNLIGQTVTINGHKLTVIGVAPPEYTGMIRGFSSEFWVPANMLPVLEPRRREVLTHRGSSWLTLIGRLKSGVTVEQAQARFDVLSREMQAAYPDQWRRTDSESGAIREKFVTVVSERQTRIHPDMQLGAYAAIAMVIVIVNLVLLIACMNLASMLLARAVVRRREIAVRLALGAGRWRIVRQLTAESVLLSLIAGAIGLITGVWLLNLLLAVMPAFPEGIRVALDIRLDWRVFAYTLGFSILIGVLFGLAPALQSSRTDVSTVLKGDSMAFAGSRRRSRIRATLVVAQVALSLLLLIGAGLVLRSLEKVRPTRLGFSSDNVVVASVQLDGTKYNRARSQAFYQQLAERVGSLPGVRAVSFVDAVPGGFLNRTRRGTEIEGYQPSPGETLEIDSNIVGPRYFTNLEVPIVAGRDFEERDREGAPCVAIVNEAFGRRYFSSAGSPLGKHLAKFDSGSLAEKRMCEIVGVVRDDRWQSLQHELRPFYWLALQQTHRTRMSMLVNTHLDPGAQIAGVRRTLLELEPNMPVSDIQTLRDYFSATAFPFRLLGVVIGVSGLAALLLATVGVYGIVAYSVAQRTREVGIRIALGALRTQILRMVVGQGMVLVLWGLGLGLILSFGLTRVLTSSLFGTALLFGVSATDSLTFAGVTILLALVALLACWVPAIRATKVDPIHALRYE